MTIEILQIYDKGHELESNEINKFKNSWLSIIELFGVVTRISA